MTNFPFLTTKISYAYNHPNARYDYYADKWAKNQILHIRKIESWQYALTLWDGNEIFQYEATADVQVWVNVEVAA